MGRGHRPNLLGWDIAELEQALRVTCHAVDFDVHRIADAALGERGCLPRMWNQVDFELQAVDFVDGQTDPVDADGALAGDEARQSCRHLETPAFGARIRDDIQDTPQPVDMTGNQMSAERI